MGMNVSELAILDECIKNIATFLLQIGLFGKRKGGIAHELAFLFLVRSGAITLSFQLITSWQALLRQPCG